MKIVIGLILIAIGLTALLLGENEMRVKDSDISIPTADGGHVHPGRSGAGNRLGVCPCGTGVIFKGHARACEDNRHSRMEASGDAPRRRRSSPRSGPGYSQLSIGIAGQKIPDAMRPELSKSRQ